MLTHWLVPAYALRPALLPCASSATAGSAASHSRSGSKARWQAALQVAGLDGLNRSPGGWTVLAPSDEAFEAFLGERAMGWAALLADVPTLRELLLGHVLADRYTAHDLPAGFTPALAADGLIEVTHSAAGPLLRDAQGRTAKICRADLPAGSGGTSVLHIIDRVLPPPAASLLELLDGRPEFSAFTEALRRTELAALLAGSARLTVLAPHNDGFRHLAARLGLRQRELMARPALLREVLGHHLLPGRWLSSELPWGGQLPTLAHQALALAALGLVGKGDAAQPLLPGSDQRARNGLLHRLAAPVLTCP